MIQGGKARLWTLGGALLAHVGIFAGLFRSVYSMRESGTGLFYDYAGRILQGQLPYRDFFAEYPPLALVFFTVPRVLGDSFRWYYVWYQLEVVIADVLIVVALYLAARRWSLSPERLIALYTVAVLAVGPINLQQFDIFPAAFSLFSVLWFAAGGVVGAGIMLALGVMTKVYPILLAPIFVLVAWRENRRAVYGAIAAFVATCFVVLLPWLVVSPSSLRGMVGFHTERGIHLDSVYSTIAFAASGIGAGWVDIIFNFRSWNIAGPFVNVLAGISSFVLLAVLAAVYALVYRSGRRAETPHDVNFVGHAAFLVIVAAMAASKVLSPQYLVWFTPFVPFIIGPRQRAVWVAVVATGLLTYYLYPVRYEALLRRETSALWLLAARNCALILTAILAASSLRRTHTEFQR